MWHVSSRSGVATLQTAIHLLLTYLLTYRHLLLRAVQQSIDISCLPGPQQQTRHCCSSCCEPMPGRTDGRPTVIIIIIIIINDIYLA